MLYPLLLCMFSGIRTFPDEEELFESSFSLLYIIEAIFLNYKYFPEKLLKMQKWLSDFLKTRTSERRVHYYTVQKYEVIL